MIKKINHPAVHTARVHRSTGSAAHCNISCQHSMALLVNSHSSPSHLHSNTISYRHY